MKKKRYSSLLWPLITLAVILVFNFIFTKGFFNIEIKNGHLFGSVIDIVKRAVPVMIISIGMTMVIATKGIDISVGSIIAISGAIAAIIILNTGFSLFFVILLSLCVAFIFGAFNGLLISYIGIQPVVATLILMVAGRGVAQLITNGYVLYIDHKAFEYLGIGFFFGIPFSIVITVIVFIITYLVTRTTAIGLLIQAVGGNPRASYYTGINVKSIKFFVYAFSGLCAGISGLIISSDIKGADPSFAGLWVELDAILAVVIGGTPFTGGKYYLFGSIIGSLIIQSLTTTILTRGVPVQYTLVVKAVVVFIVIIIQSTEFRQKVIRGLKRKI
jgi:ribose/xylose/arabinose/galactoside ABC-type transport system permease subunit